MEYCPYPKYDMIYRPDMYNLQVRKKHPKNEQELKLTFQKMPLLNNLQYQYKMVRNEIYNLQTRLVQFKDQKKLNNA